MLKQICYLLAVSATVLILTNCQQKNRTMKNNPLLETFATPHHTPPFDIIEEEHFPPAIKQAIVWGEDDVNRIIENAEVPTFENTIAALDDAGSVLGKVSSIFFNLNGAHTNDNIQAIAREVSPLLTAFQNSITLNADLFTKVKAVYDAKQAQAYSPEQLMLVEDTYRKFVRKGALLQGDKRTRYEEISTELANLSLQFGENILKETNAYSLHLTQEDEVAGLPDAIKSAAKQLAEKDSLAGYVFTLQFPSYVPFMQYADNRELRKQMYMAYLTRSFKDNEQNNTEVITQIVNFRLELAQLLGYKDYATYVLENRMAQTPDKVNQFLDDLLNASLPHAQNEMAELSAFAKNMGLDDELQRWDFSYYSEKLKSEKFSINDEMTKPYFPLAQVTKGIFELANTLYGITFAENKNIPVYHEEVEAYEVFDKDGGYLAVLYMDFFPRESKRGGAWMTTFGEQYQNGDENVRPHVSLVCNFSRPTNETPSLLTFQEVRTYLHEFGHGLHGMLSQIQYKSLSGTSVYRDFVELPSQIMENWGTEEEWLQAVGKHYETQEVIPAELIAKIKESANFLSGYQSVRQLSFGISDMAWHSLQSPLIDVVEDFEEKAMGSTELFPKVPGTCFSTGFSHIFAGGYAAGYYGYKWAEVLDADAFSLFKQKGIYDKVTANSFRTNILEKGGSVHPMELYVAFRGQEPTVDALLEREGLR